MGFTLVNVYISIDRSTMFSGKIHYFYGPFSDVNLPEAGFQKASHLDWNLIFVKDGMIKTRWNILNQGSSHHSSMMHFIEGCSRWYMKTQICIIPQSIHHRIITWWSIGEKPIKNHPSFTRPRNNTKTSALLVVKFHENPLENPIQNPHLVNQHHHEKSPYVQWQKSLTISK